MNTTTFSADKKELEIILESLYQSRLRTMAQDDAYHIRLGLIKKIQQELQK